MNKVIRLHVNDKPVEAAVSDGDLSLVEFLQERLDFTGTKLCCGIGACRACTVGTRTAPNAPMEKTLACSISVSAMEQMHVYTVEGLAQGDQLSLLQQSFLESFAFQCGYCAPGFLMAATAMLDHLPEGKLSDAEIDALIHAWVGSNLCRCTGYQKYIDAIRKVVAMSR